MALYPIKTVGRYAAWSVAEQVSGGAYATRIKFVRDDNWGQVFPRAKVREIDKDVFGSAADAENNGWQWLAQSYAGVALVLLDY